MTVYTLVQHTARLNVQDASFERGVEPMALRRQKDIDLVVSVGGLVFDSYMKAEDAADEYMYPPGTEGIVPQVRGNFPSWLLDREFPVYIPEAR